MIPTQTTQLCLCRIIFVHQEVILGCASSIVAHAHAGSASTGSVAVVEHVKVATHNRTGHAAAVCNVVGDIASNTGAQGLIYQAVDTKPVGKIAAFRQLNSTTVDGCVTDCGVAKSKCSSVANFYVELSTSHSKWCTKPVAQDHSVGCGTTTNTIKTAHAGVSETGVCGVGCE